MDAKQATHVGLIVVPLVLVGVILVEWHAAAVALSYLILLLAAANLVLSWNADLLRGSRSR